MPNLGEIIAALLWGKKEDIKEEKTIPKRRRDFPRIKWYPVNVRVVVKPYTAYPGRLTNLSRSGALITYPFPLDIGKEFTFVLPRDELTGEVVELTKVDELTGKALRLYDMRLNMGCQIAVQFNNEITDQGVIKRYYLRRWQQQS